MSEQKIEKASERTIEVLTKALEKIRDRSNFIYQAGHEEARRIAVDNYNTANVALISVGKAK